MTAIQFEGLEIQSGEAERYIRDFIVHVASRERLAIEAARAQCSAAARLTGNCWRCGRWYFARVLRVAIDQLRV